MRSALARRMRAVALTSGQTDDVTTNGDLVRVTETTAHTNSGSFPFRESKAREGGWLVRRCSRVLKRAGAVALSI